MESSSLVLLLSAKAVVLPAYRYSCKIYTCRWFNCNYYNIKSATLLHRPLAVSSLINLSQNRCIYSTIVGIIQTWTFNKHFISALSHYFLHEVSVWILHFVEFFLIETTLDQTIPKIHKDLWRTRIGIFHFTYSQCIRRPVGCTGFFENMVILADSHLFADLNLVSFTRTHPYIFCTGLVSFHAVISFGFIPMVRCLVLL